MSFRATLAELKKPHIYTLVETDIDGTKLIKGFRVKVCKAQRGRGAVPVIKYYDFGSSLIKDAGIREFLQQNITAFDSLDLIKQGETDSEATYMTQDEIDGTVTPEEFVDSAEALKVLKVAKDFYENK